MLSLLLSDCLPSRYLLLVSFCLCSVKTLSATDPVSSDHHAFGDWWLLVKGSLLKKKQLTPKTPIIAI